MVIERYLHPLQARFQDELLEIDLLGQGNYKLILIYFKIKILNTFKILCVVKS